MYVVIIGGGNVGYYLAKALMSASHEVLLMERNRTTYRTVAEELGEVAMQGDGCEIRLLEEAGVGRADVVVAATGDDDDNLVICQMSKMMFNVPRTIARVNNPRNEDLFHRFGIDETVSSTKIIYNLIEQEIETGEVIPLAALRRGNIEIVEVEIGSNSPVLGVRPAELELPGGALIISVIRNDHGIIPTTETRLEAGDGVLALVDASHEHELRGVFAEGIVRPA
jgi:trk system potassium uptake protein